MSCGCGCNGGSSAGSTGMCETEKWAMIAVVAAFVLLLYVSFK